MGTGQVVNPLPLLLPLEVGNIAAEGLPKLLNVKLVAYSGRPVPLVIRQT